MTFPSKIVMSTRTFSIFSGAIVKRSSDSTTTPREQAGGDAADLLLGEHRPGVVARVAAQRFLDGKPLLGDSAVRIATVECAARHGGVDAEHGIATPRDA
jgi:hypothetical protein